MTEFLPFIAIICVALGLVVFAVISGQVRYQRGLKEQKVIDEGVYDFVTYGEHAYTKRSGAMVHTTTHHVAYTTAIYFIDGRTRIIRGLHSVEFPTGTKIKIMRNGNGDCWIEKVE